MIIKDNIVAYRPQLLPSIEVARFCTYKHTSPTDGTYYGRTQGVTFSLEELNKNRWGDGEGYCRHEAFYRAIQKYGWDNFKHEVCITHLFDWECSFVELCGVLDSMSTGHSYNIAIPLIGGGQTQIDHDVLFRISESSRLRWEDPEYKISTGASISKGKIQGYHPLRGKTMPELWKDNISKSVKFAYSSGKHSKNNNPTHLLSASKAYWSDPNNHKLASERSIKRFSDPVQRKIQSDAANRRFEDPYQRAVLCIQSLRQHHTNWSSTEILDRAKFLHPDYDFTKIKIDNI